MTTLLSEARAALAALNTGNEVLAARSLRRVVNGLQALDQAGATLRLSGDPDELARSLDRLAADITRRART